MYLGLAALFIIIVFVYIRLRPVHGLTSVDRDRFCEMKDKGEVQILDVRDPVDYEKKHLKDALNIYVGRLPYVNLHELRPDVDIVIVSPSGYQIRKAARILLKAGYRRIYGYQWKPQEQDRINGTSKPCCA